MVFLSRLRHSRMSDDLDIEADYKVRNTNVTQQGGGAGCTRVDSPLAAVARRRELAERNHVS